MKSKTVSIVITTKNRKQELKKCLDSCLKMAGIFEILVFDDGSSDNTFEYVRDNFPTINLFRSESSLGLINARSRCAELAKGDYLLSIDDDCVFQDTDTVVEVMQYFNHPRIAAITIPAIDVYKSPEVTHKGIGDLNTIYICPQYRGCAHIIKKDIFIKLGMYRSDLVRQEEETDLALKLYDQNYVIRISDCKNPILHYHSSVRNENQIAFYRSRNKLLLVYVHTPTIFLLLFLIRITVNLISLSITTSQLSNGLKGLLDAYKLIFTGAIERTPQKIKTFLFYKRLRKNRRLQIQL